MVERLRCRPRPSSSTCLVSGKRSWICSDPIFDPLRFRERRVEGKAGNRAVRSAAVSIQCDFASMARLRYTSSLAAG